MKKRKPRWLAGAGRSGRGLAHRKSGSFWRSNSAWSSRSSWQPTQYLLLAMSERRSGTILPFSYSFSWNLSWHFISVPPLIYCLYYSGLRYKIARVLVTNIANWYKLVFLSQMVEARAIGLYLLTVAGTIYQPILVTVGQFPTVLADGVDHAGAGYSVTLGPPPASRPVLGLDGPRFHLTGSEQSRI